MLDFNLEYYRAFYYVSQLGSISRAANALCLSQPAVTRSIQKLEEDLACSLFLRTPKGMEQTAAGKVLFSHIAKAFEEMLAGEKELRLMTAYTGGQLEIGTTETAIYYYLLPKIEEFRKHNPGVQIHLTGISTPEILKTIRDGEADFAVAVSPLPDTGDMRVTTVRTFCDILIAGPVFGSLKDRSLSLAELCTLPLVTVERGTSARRHLDKWFEEQGILFRPEYSVQTSSLVLPFVRHGLAVGFLPEMFTEEPIRKGEVFALRVEKEIPPREIVIIKPEGANASPVCSQFLDFLQASAHETAEQ